MAGPRNPTLASALVKALRAVETRPEDTATVALARRLAHDIDEAELVHADVRGALDELATVDADLHERLFKLAVRIESTAVLTALAPKLTAVLIELGMTPRARASVVGRGVGSGDGAGRRSKLDELRERRAVREHAASAVD